MAILTSLRFSALVGFRYAGAKRRQQLVSFISGLSIMGMAVGVGLLITVLSVMNGMVDWQPLREQFLASDGVTGVAPFVELQGMLSFGREVMPVFLYGIDSSLEKDVSAIMTFLSPEVVAQLDEGGSVILGAGVAQKLSADVGNKVKLFIPDKQRPNKLPRFRALTVVSIVETKTELDYALVLTDVKTAQQLTDNPDAVSGLRIKFDDLFQASAWIQQQMRSLPHGYYGSDWTRSHGNLYHAIQMSKSLVGLLLFLIVAIAAFNVISTLVMVVVDKQGDIAILRTLGATRFEIMAIFMWQGTLIGVAGTLLGVVLGALGAWGVQDAVHWLEIVSGFQFLQSDVYPISYVPSEPQWQDFVWVAMVALVMSFLATIYPAWRAAKTEPAEALRFE